MFFFPFDEIISSLLPRRVWTDQVHKVRKKWTLKQLIMTFSNNKVSLTTISDEHMITINMLCNNLLTDISKGLKTEQAKQILKQTGKNAFRPPESTIRDSCREKLGSPYGGKLTRAEWQRLVGQRIHTEVCVFRDGQKQWISGNKIVCGDLVVLQKHDFVPADIRVLDSNNLIIDNRLITGNKEEMKTHSSCAQDCLLSPNMVFCCTKVVEGHCVGIVLRRGEDTVFGTLKNYATRVRFDALRP